MQSLIPALREAVAGIEAAKATWLAHWEKMAVRVAAAIASRVIRREVERAPEITLDLVRETLELAAGSSDVQLRLHPDDLATLGDRASQLAAEIAKVGTARVVGDPRIERGSCRVDTRFGRIDAQFAAQLARIEEELT